MKIRPALKGRNKILDHKPVLPLQGVAILNYSQHAIRFPGRCPGLACRCPFGARFKKRNFKNCFAGVVEQVAAAMVTTFEGAKTGLRFCAGG